MQYEHGAGAAGIAHELKNPIAVIQGNLDLTRELLGADAGKVHAELKLADEQMLGLWISRSIVERCGGDIRAANRHDGRRGAVFSVLLPGKPANAAPDPEA